MKEEITIKLKTSVCDMGIDADVTAGVLYPFFGVRLIPIRNGRHDSQLRMGKRESPSLAARAVMKTRVGNALARSFILSGEAE